MFSDPPQIHAVGVWNQDRDRRALSFFLFFSRRSSKAEI